MWKIAIWLFWYKKVGGFFDKRVDELEEMIALNNIRGQYPYYSTTSFCNDKTLEAQFSGTSGSLRTIAHPQLLQNIMNVPLGGAHTDEQFVGNFLVGFSRHDQA